MPPSLLQVREEIVALLPRMRRFARMLTHDRHDADDLVQTAVERALARIEQFQPGTRLDAWLFGIVRNAWIDEVRSRKRRSEIFAPEEAGSDVGVSDTEQQHAQRVLRAAMRKLPEEQRTVIALVLIEGLSYAEAATVLEIPQGTVTSRLARGRAALQALLHGGTAP